ncbi:dimethyl sulfoxide reductase anchor subunit family protein [Gallibacterium salpingitidis]|uniref:Dimethyl sulfoxide reductase n=1 Tax=Gallibacterium salpingitidis TaxID=505341 RepID=A0A1A7NZP9_9PAST|nr:DmsC/YnfH family molybdoenzyme membrane anchor subunit [Gallibacterium salpingitidis]OBW94966.1 hypothetical protein QS62_04775 [Gallibacterium salpingitidis]
MHEWPLIAFTTLIQISIGCFLLTMFYRINGKQEQTIHLPLMVSWFIGGVGLFVSVFHLGNPWHIFNTINNIFSSWMSREVVFVGGYMGLLTLSIACLIWRKIYINVFLMLTTIVGICTVFVMSNIYVNSLFLLWNGWITYSSFVATTLIAGGVIACLALVISLREQHNFLIVKQVITQFFTFAALAVVLNIISYLYLQGHIASNATMGISAKYVDSALVLQLTLIKAILLVIGLSCMIFFRVKLEQGISLFVISIASISIVVAEIIGRCSFFFLGA